MPRSRAIRRASGLALMRSPVSSAVDEVSPFCCAGLAPDMAGSAAAGSAGAAGAAGGGSTATVSPASPLTASVWPTGTSPDSTAIFSSTPLASASTSCVALSVSTSKSGSPFSTRSPSDFSHLTIVPASIPCPRRGSFTSLLTRHPPPHRREHVVPRRDDELLHLRRERERRKLRPDALDRRVEPVERLLLQHGHDLGAEAHPRHGLVGDDGAVRLLHRLHERLRIERLQRARVDDLDRDPVRLRRLRGLQRAVHERPRRDHGHVGALAYDACLAERNRLELLRRLLLDRIEQPVLEEDDGVVVVDRRPQ